MNQEECTAEKYLKSLSLGVPIFEPLGFKKPPDFGLERTVGIEVRRLNQNYFDGDTASGLEEVSIPIHMTFKKALESFDSSFEGFTFWVSITYKRPLPSSKLLLRGMKDTLTRYLKDSKGAHRRLDVIDGVEFDIRPSESIIANRVFRRAITSDEDSGGLVTQMYVDNILYCIEQKCATIAPVKQEFKEWWLILVDTMMVWNLEPEEVAQIRSGIHEYGEFGQIIILDYFGDNVLMRLER